MADYVKKETFIQKSREANPELYGSDVPDETVYNEMISAYPEYKDQIYEEANILSRGISKFQSWRDSLSDKVDETYAGIAPNAELDTDPEMVLQHAKDTVYSGAKLMEYYQADNKYEHIDTTFKVAQMKKKLATKQPLDESDYATLESLMRWSGAPKMQEVTQAIQNSENPAQALSQKLDELVAKKYLDKPNKEEKKWEIYQKASEYAMQYDNKVEFVANTFDEKSVRDWVKTEQKRYEAIADYEEMKDSTRAMAERKGFDTSSISYMVGAGIPSVGVSIGTAIALSPFTGGASLLGGVLSLGPAALLSTPEAFETYRAARNAGADREEAKYYALTSFVLNTSLEHIGIQTAIGKIGGKYAASVVPKTIITGLMEGATEFSQEETAAILELYGYDKGQLDNMSTEDKIERFINMPLKAGLVGSILGAGTSVSFDSVSSVYDRMKLKAKTAGLDPKLVEKWDTYLKKNKKVAKKIEAVLKKQQITDFTQEGIMKKLQENGVPKTKLQEAYDALMMNPVFVSKKEIAESTKSSRFLLGSKDPNKATSTFGALMTSIYNIPGALNRVSYDYLDILDIVSPTTARVAKQVYRKGQMDANDAMNAMLEPVKKAFKVLKKPLRSRVKLNNGEGMQLNKVITVYSHLQQIANSKESAKVKKLKLEQLGLTQEQLSAVKEYVESDKSVLAFAKALTGIFDVMYYYTNEGHKTNHNGKGIEKFESYFPVMYDVLANQGIDFGDAIAAVATPRGAKSVGPVDPKSAKERAKVARSSIDLNIPIDRLLNSMIKKISEYYGMSAPAAQVQSMINAIGPDLVSNYGPKMYSYMQNMNKSMARGIATPSYLMGIDKAARKFKETSYSVLNMNMTVWATQSASFWNGANEIGIQAALEGLTRVMENPAQAVKEMYAESQEAKYRMGVDYTQQELNQIAKEVKTDFLGKNIKELREMARAGMFPMKVVDMLTTASIWQGAKNKYLHENGDGNIEAAIEYADNAISASQPMTNTIHRSLLSKMPVMHIFSQFGAARVKGGAQLTKAIVRASQGQSTPLQLINSVVLTKIAPAISVAMARSFFSKWEDDPAEQMWQNFTQALIGSNIFMGQLMSSWTYHDGNLVIPAAGRPVKLAIKSAKALVEGEYDEALYNAIELQMNTMFTMSLQLPYKKAVNFLSNFEM